MSGHVPVSAVVLTANESANLDACLKTLAWADERLVVDSFSTDGSMDGGHVADRVVQRRFVDHASQRQEALLRAVNDWVLFVDADERVSRPLAQEIRQRAGRDDYVGYWIPRRNRIFGRWMRASGWWPDRQLRLMDRRAAAYDLRRPIHELVRPGGPVGLLTHPLEHYSYASIAQFRSRQRRLAPPTARSLFESGVRRRPTAVVAQPLRELVRRLVTLQGYRDGRVGLLLALLMAEHEWQVQWQLRACWRQTAARASA